MIRSLSFLSYFIQPWKLYQFNFLGEILAGASIVTGLLGSKSASKSAAAEASAQREAAAEMREFRKEVKEESTPYMEAGRRGLASAEELMASPELVKDLPGYEFRLQEGLRGVRSALTAKGTLFSGQAAKALTRYGQEYATTEYEKELARRFGFAELGLRGTQTWAQAGGQAAAGAAGYQAGAGQAIAQGSAQQAGLFGTMSGMFAQRALGGIQSSPIYTPTSPGASGATMEMGGLTKVF